MASWFALLCTVDDEIEQMTGYAAQLSITESIAVLEHSASQANRRRSSLYIPKCTTCDTQRVSALTKAFVSQVRGLLPTHVYANLVKSITRVWQAMATEQSCRDLPIIDQKTFLSIRMRTVGLHPFYVLLSHAFKLSRWKPEVQSLLKELETSLALAVGLQNDMLGLSKDLDVGETFNFVVFGSRNGNDDLDSSLERAVAMHNAAVERAFDCWEEIGERCDADSGQMRYAESLLGFVASHFAWASKAERYAVDS
ncbi:hypothetical protein LTR08_009189 [Meristemomyces frigidus]|nr:hypothetical protein LTR08_009189 [Meristemomyces frigidus]